MQKKKKLDYLKTRLLNFKYVDYTIQRLQQQLASVVRFTCIVQ